MQQDNVPLNMTIFIDPISSSCWIMEPVIRKIYVEYGHILNIKFKVLPIFNNVKQHMEPQEIADHWETISFKTGTPISGDVWRKDPPKSSNSVCKAYKAAQIIDAEKSNIFLLRLKIALFIESINIENEDFFFNLAKEVGYDLEIFKRIYKLEGEEIIELDQKLAEAYDIKQVPTIVIEKAGKNKQIFKGFTSFEKLESTICQLNPSIQKESLKLDVNDQLKNFGTLTVKEVAQLNDISEEESKQLLDQSNYSKRKSCNNVEIWIS